MAKITGLTAKDESGTPILCDAFGNNVAFLCLKCGGPVIAVIRANQRGSSSNNPSQCPSCLEHFWVSLAEADRSLVVHRVG